MSNGTNQSFTESRLYQWLGILARLLGPPTLILLICRALNVPDNIAHVISLTFLIFAAVLLFGKKYIRLVLTSLLLALCIILAAALVFTLYKTSDPWVQWKERVFESIRDCKDKDNPCVAMALKRPYPGPDSNLLMSRLTCDERAGSIIMQNERARKMLEKQLGINSDTFLGTGLTQPSGESNYSAARMPEYLVPNHLDSDAGVWTWVLDPIRDSDRILSEVIEKQPPTHQPTQSGGDLISNLQFIKKRFSLDDKKPAVVRISQFPLDLYSGKLGRKEVDRVFVTHLGSVWGMKIGEVAKYSGRTKATTDGKERLFLWVFLPTDEMEVVPGTWGEILSHVSDWIK